MNELALFAGAGGGILGGHLLGWLCVCAVERDAYAAAVLAQRQNDGCLPAFPIWSDVETFDGRPWRGIVDVISGGFPCQDISTAGKGAGITGSRSGLWKEFARIIGEVGPRYVLVENSPALTGRGMGVVLGDLAALGYDASWGVLGAVDAGAPHKRERIWIVADCENFRRGARGPRGSDSGGAGECEQAFQAVADALCDGAGEELGGACAEAGPSKSTARRRQWGQPSDGRKDGDVADSEGFCEREPADETDAEPDSGKAWAESVRDGECEGDVSDSEVERFNMGRLPLGTDEEHPESGSNGEDETVSNSDEAGCSQQWRAGTDGEEHEAAECGGWWIAEPALGRVAHGVAHRVDRLAALGNGQVSAVVRLAWEILTENNEHKN